MHGQPWTLTGNLPARIEQRGGREVLEVDAVVLRALGKEQERRAENLELIAQLRSSDPRLAEDAVLLRWEAESQPLPDAEAGDELPIRRVMGDPAHVKQRLTFATSEPVKRALGRSLQWDPEDSYAYGRAFANNLPPQPSDRVVLDPTAGGGSIPFEALRLGHQVIANELNPVATTILYATLDFPARFGPELVDDIEHWGRQLLDHVEREMDGLAPFSPIPHAEWTGLQQRLAKCPELVADYDHEYDHNGLIYCRQVTCPHCQGEAPLLNTCWLSKEASDPWGVRVITHGHDAQGKHGKVRFETYRIGKGRGPNDEDPNRATVTRGVGQCVHCKQAIPGDEIKAQARGESPLGRWTDRLYTVVAIRREPKLDQHGRPQRYTSGERAGEIKTRKIRYFRPPVERDLAALTEAEQRLQARWDAWDEAGLIPTERFPEGNDNRPINYGMERWCDLFTPRQLLGHLNLIDGLNRLKPRILEQLGEARGRAVITYLQFAIDKGLDYNSKQTRWHFSRGAVVGTFGRHDFSLKWTFGEMIFTGPNSGAAWGLSQVIDAYKGMAELLRPVHEHTGGNPPLRIINGTAGYLGAVADGSVDLVCMDPPYYNNVQYAELSDYFYVWQRRTLADLYPELFRRRLTEKRDEAVANPARDGGPEPAKAEYQRLMAEIFRECRRVLRDDGLMTLMFTHKEQAAWETLTRSLIEAGWTITASFPVESEGENSMHQRDMAAAASSIFIACRKRPESDGLPALWQGLGGRGVAARIRESVRQGLSDFAPLRLNPVDRMVACYGRALQVLSEHWPVLDGDEPVSPIRAMTEASAVVAEAQVREITRDRLSVAGLDAETGLALLVYGIWGHAEFAFADALNLSKSLNLALEGKTGGYRAEPGRVGLNTAAAGRRGRETPHYPAPLIRQGSKLRLARPEERDPRRLAQPQTDWDRLHGLLMAYREGDVPSARPYLDQQAAGRRDAVLDLLGVWIEEADEEGLQREGEALRFGL